MFNDARFEKALTSYNLSPGLHYKSIDPKSNIDANSKENK